MFFNSAEIFITFTTHKVSFTEMMLEAKAHLHQQIMAPTTIQPPKFLCSAVIQLLRLALSRMCKSKHTFLKPGCVISSRSRLCPPPRPHASPLTRCQRPPCGGVRPRSFPPRWALRAGRPPPSYRAPGSRTLQRAPFPRPATTTRFPHRPLRAGSMRRVLSPYPSSWPLPRFPPVHCSPDPSFASRLRLNRVRLLSARGCVRRARLNPAVCRVPSVFLSSSGVGGVFVARMHGSELTSVINLHV